MAAETGCVGQAGGTGSSGDGFYRELIDRMSDGVYFVDRGRRITYWSGGAARLTGFDACDVESRRCGEGLLSHVDDEGVPLCGSRCPLSATMCDGQPREAHVYLRHADGHRQPVWMRAAAVYSDDQIVGAVETFGDDTARRQAEVELAALREAAQVDSLTGLGNRRFLDRQLEAWLNDWGRHESPFGVLFADIDRFKAINDGYGHEVGDDALTVVGRTIAHATRANDLAARYGGEEFVLLVRGGSGEVVATAERLRRLIAASRLAAARELIEITVSIGVTMVAAGDDAETLLRRADLALHAAKQAGRNRVECRAMGASGSQMLSGPECG